MAINIKYEPSRKQIRNYIFLKDVVLLTFSAFGGPQAHVAMMFKHFVEKRKYVTEEELIELNALCQILPGPTSTQTITAVGYKIGGVFLATMTLLVWMIPAISLMTLAAMAMVYAGENQVSIDFARYVGPMAVGFVAYAAYKISTKVVKSKTGFVLMLLAALASLFVRKPWIFPLLILLGGAVTAREYRRHNRQERDSFKIRWINLVVFLGIFVISAVMTGFTSNIFVKLFENFYRSGSLIFGGGQVLIPLIRTEFVDAKNYLTQEQFDTGFGLVQALPGPVFSFTSFVGGLTASKAGYGTSGIILGGAVSAVAIFLPGTLLIFFVVKIWEELKKVRIVWASLAGINATASGMVIAAALIMFFGVLSNSTGPFGAMDTKKMIIDIVIMLVTFGLLGNTKIPSPVIVAATIGLGFIL